ncbi:hypothetical protein [uncultured Amnibacterium sp.]|uniref:hypothetical protein n=1 Tax=uncultured Amnibacterium sp. TaxID=1631851 RepID=UPI0035CAE9FB
MLVLAPNLSANATTPSLRDKFQSFWTDHGVKANTRASLLKAYDAGQMPDAVTGKSSSTDVTKRVGDYVVTTSTYADGSVSVSQVQAPLPTYAGTSSRVKPMAISGCSTGGTSGHITYSNCYVSGNNAAITVGFQTSFTYVQGGYDLIENKGKNSYQQCAPGQCTDPIFDSWRQYETASAKAFLKYRFNYSVLGSTGTGFLQLTVGDTSASSKFTAP